MKRGFRRILSVALTFFVLAGSINLGIPAVKASACNMVEDASAIPKIKPVIAEIHSSVPNKSDEAKALPSNGVQSVMAAMPVSGNTANIIVNGDFEQELSSSGTWMAFNKTTGNAGIFTWDSQIYHGSAGHSMQIQGTDVGSACVNQIPIKPGYEYSFSVWAKAQGVTITEEKPGPYIYVSQYDINNIEIENSGHYFHATAATFDWEEANCSFTANPNAASVFIILGLNGSGTVWYDDASMSENMPENPNIPVSGVAIDSPPISINAGQTRQMTATVAPDNATNKNVLWTIQSQSANNVVSISSTGLLSALNPGTAVIRAVCEGDPTKFSDCNVTVSESKYSVLPKNAVISDTVMDPSKPVMYAVDTANLKLYAVNYETKTVTESAFNLKPERIAYSNGKLYVTLLKNQHSSYIFDDQQTGAIAIMDTANLSLIKQLDVATDPFDIDVSGDNIFVSSGSGQWTHIRSYSEATGQQISSYTISERSYIESNPSLSRVYSMDTSSSPMDYTTFDVNNGMFTKGHDSPYHGDYSMAGKFRITPDGKYAFNGSGLILTCDADASKDLRFVFMLNKPFADVAFDMANNKFYTAVQGKTIYSYEYNTFAGLSVINSDGEISALYYKDGKLVALSRIGEQYVVETIDTSGGTVVTPPCAATVTLNKDGSKLLLNYMVKDSIKDPVNPIIYLTDDVNKKIVAVNYLDGTAKELSTYYAPGSIAYYNDEIYVGFGSQGIIGIYDAKDLSLKDSIYTGAAFIDMNVGGNGFIYTSYNDYARSFSRATKQEVSKIFVFNYGYLEVNPVMNSLYFSSMNCSPTDLFTIKYSDGNLTSHYDSTYHGDYYIAERNRISPDGRYIFNTSGEVFYCAQKKEPKADGTYDNANTDMTHAFSLSNGRYNDITFDVADKKLYTGSTTGITAYDYSNFKAVNYFASSGEIAWLYNLDNQLVAIEKKDGKCFIETIEKAGFGALPSTSPAPTSSNMPIFTQEKAAGAIAITAGANVTGVFQNSTASNWYKLCPDTNGIYTITGPQNIRSACVFDGNGFEIAFKMYSGNMNVYMEAGRTYYIALANYYSSETYILSVSLNEPITEIKLNKTTASINTGASEQLTASVTPPSAGTQNIKWLVQSQSGTNVANVSSTGLVTAVNPGTAVIRAVSAADSGVYAECTVTVTLPDITVTEIKLNKTSTSIQVGQSEQLVASVMPSNAPDKSLTWSVHSQSTNDVVTVSANGVVTAKNTGTAVVWATSNANKSISTNCFITVVNNTATIGGVINTFAGIDSYGYSGDGGPAAVAKLYSPMAVAIDGSGNVYIADYHNHRVRKVSPDGIISTVAGTGTTGNSGDGGPALSAQLGYPQGLAVDSIGNLYISDVMNQNIRKVSPDGKISTVVGTGTYGYSGDGGPAVSAQLGSPSGVAVDKNGILYVADYANSRIRRIGSDGIITTVVGTGTAGYSGDGGPATSAKLNCPRGVTFDNKGNMYISDSYNNRIRKVDTNGIITTIAGTGTYGYAGDGGSALSAQLRYPSGAIVDSAGNLYVADQQNHRIRKIDTQGIITTAAGTGGTNGYIGDGGAACSAQLFNPADIAVDTAGNLYIADSNNNRIRKVTYSNGQTPAVIAVSGITLDKNTATITAGRTAQLKATILPVDATNKNVIWTVPGNGNNIVTVSQTGLVTAISSGTAIVQAASEEDKSKYAQCSITVVPASGLPVYDMDIWTPKASMNVERLNPGVVELNGRIYVIGGMDEHSIETNKMEIYDPVADTWTAGCDMFTARHGLNAVALDGKIYAIGGYYNGNDLNVVEMYDPITNTWVPKAGIADGRSDFGSAVVNGKIYIIGGHASGAAVNSIEEYDPKSNTWTIKGNMPAEYCDYNNLGSVEAGGEIYLFGGTREKGGVCGTSKIMMAYNPLTGVWTRKADMPTARYILGATVLNGFIYAIGGKEDSGYNNVLSTVEEFDIKNNTWKSKQNMITARYYVDAVTSAGRIYTIGGFANNTKLKVVEEYVPEQTPDKVDVASVSLNKSSITLKQAQTEQLTALISPLNATDKGVTWFVTNQNPTGVATVSATGIVTALKPGIAVIRAVSNADSSKYADCSITVTENLVSQFNIEAVPNNTLKLGDDLFDINSDVMKEPDAATAIASLIKDGQNKNKAYFKFGGKWYSSLDLKTALTPEQVAALRGFGRWYKAGSEVVEFAQGSYNITQLNQLTASLSVKLGNVPGAAYFNIYRKSNGVLVNTMPVAIDSGLTSLPAVFSNADDLEVWLYSDAEGKNKIAALKLDGNSECGILKY